VTWADGSTSEHRMAGPPYKAPEAARETLEHKLVDYLDPGEWPTDVAGLPLGWVAVEIV
jgi:hypothetical protein